MESEVVVDSTVQEKNVTYPLDTKQYRKIIIRCWKLADRNGVRLRRRYRKEVRACVMAQRLRKDRRKRKAASRLRPSPRRHRKPPAATRRAARARGQAAFVSTSWPTVLLAAKTYAKDPLKRAVSAGFCISCAPREALYVLDGLLENDSVLRLREHSTDTHGYIEDLFGLCYLLGYSFMPRIRDLADQQLYRIDRNAVYPDLAGLFRGGVDADLIWIAVEDLARVSPLLHRHVIPNGTYHFPRAIEGVNLS